MRKSRPIIQVLAITFVTLLLSLVGIMVLISEVRQQTFRMIATSVTLPRSLHIPTNAWRILLVLAVAAMLYLVMRLIISLAIPRLRDAHNCPKCDGRIQRIHRQKTERWLSLALLLHVGRYGCINCEWSGLRRYHKHRSE